MVSSVSAEDSLRLLVPPWPWDVPNALRLAFLSNAVLAVVVVTAVVVVVAQSAHGWYTVEIN